MITREVPVAAVADLALAPPRAALAATVDDRIGLWPVDVALQDPADPASSAWVVRLPESARDLTGSQVVVVADDGPQWFRLRSLTIRGTAQPGGDRTYTVVPERVVAWDYGALRETTDESGPQPIPQFDDGGAGPAPHRFARLDAALDRARVMVVATRSARGTPFAVPLWFVTHRDRVYAGTSASSWTVRNVSACPEVAVLFGGEKGTGSARFLLRGHARAVRGAPPAAVLARMAWRYYLAPAFAATELRHRRLWGLRMRYYSQAQAAHLVISPQSFAEIAH